MHLFNLKRQILTGTILGTILGASLMATAASARNTNTRNAPSRLEITETSPYTTRGGPQGVEVMSNDTEPCTPIPGVGPTQQNSSFSAYLEEDGDWISARLTSPTLGAFSVERAEYFLIEDDTFTVVDHFRDAAMPHRVRVWITNDEEPGAEPDVIYEWRVELSDVNSNGLKRVEVVFPAPVVLEPGEHLMMAVQMHAESNRRSQRHMAVATCVQPLDDSNGRRGFWTFEEAAPFSWVNLTQYSPFNAISLPMFRAFGHTLD
ncbi:MAG: hypothetical protein ACE366_20985 [Bradymonadia bacterium]